MTHYVHTHSVAQYMCMLVCSGCCTLSACVSTICDVYADVFVHTRKHYQMIQQHADHASTVVHSSCSCCVLLLLLTAAAIATASVQNFDTACMRSKHTR
jgi:hypothetical protein